MVLTDSELDNFERLIRAVIRHEASLDLSDTKAGRSEQNMAFEDLIWARDAFKMNPMTPPWLTLSLEQRQQQLLLCNTCGAIYKPPYSRDKRQPRFVTNSVPTCVSSGLWKHRFKGQCIGLTLLPTPFGGRLNAVEALANGYRCCIKEAAITERKENG